MKKKRIPTRRFRALRHTLLALAALLLLNNVYLIGYLLPIQAVRRSEERMGVYGPTAVVERRYQPALFKTQLLYLTANEQATVLTTPYLSWGGWSPSFAVALDHSEEAPVYAGVRYLFREEETLICFFGRVDDPAAEQVTCTVEYETWDGVNTQRHPSQIRLTAQREQWLEQDGTYYFLLCREGRDWPKGAPTYPIISLYDGAGRLLEKQEIQEVL